MRHIERNSVLLFIVPIDCNDISKEYEILLHELKMYNPDLVDKPRILGISKCDIVEDEYIGLLKPEIKVDIPFYFFSSISQKGLSELKDALWIAMNQDS